MNKKVAIFTYPAISALIRNFLSLRRVEKFILYRHTDQRHPEILDNLFIFFAKKLCGKSIETRAINKFHQTPFSEEVVAALHDKDFSRNTFVRWLCICIGLEKDAACRYARRVSLERAFLEKIALNAIDEEFEDCDVLLMRVTHFIPSPESMKFHAIKGFDFLTRLLCCFVTPFIIYARLLREFLSVRFSLSTTPVQDFDLIVYEVGFRHESMSTDLNLGSTKSMHNKSSSSLVYVHDRERTCQFINDIWRPPSSLVDSYKSALTEHGYNYCDWADFKISMRMLIKLHLMWVRASLVSIIYIKSFFEIFDAARVLGLFAREAIFFENVRTRGVLGFDDYSERAIIRKHVASSNNAVALCVQHSANDGIRSGPELATVDAHYYLTLAQFARESFQRYWPQNNIVHFGYPRLDSIYEELPLRSKTVNPFQHQPNPGKPIVIIALPNIRTHHTFCETIPGAANLIELLKIAHQRYQGVLNLYLRPKQLIGWEETIKIIGFPIEQMLINRKISTAEYIYAADLVVCSVGSGIMSESALLERRFALFDVVKNQTGIYDALGDGFYNETVDDMLNQFDRLATGKPLEINHIKAQSLFSDPYKPDRAKLILDLIYDHQIETSQPKNPTIDPIKQAT